MDTYTYGDSPAAQYLSVQLNMIKSKPLTRSCGARIKTFNENIIEISGSVASGHMSAKTAANLLRMLREEASQIEVGDEFVSQLLRNVIIGKIKKAIRRVTVIRKVESANETVQKVSVKGSFEVKDGCVEYKVGGHIAGVLYTDGSYYRQYPSFYEIQDPVTSTVLAARSIKRNQRRKERDV